MTAIPETEAAAPSLMERLAGDDLGAIEKAYRAVADVLGGRLVFRPLNEKGRIDWRAKTLSAFGDAVLPLADMLTAQRLQVVVSGVAACDPSSAWVVAFSGVGWARLTVQQVAGPDLDKRVGRSVIYRALELPEPDEIIHEAFIAAAANDNSPSEQRPVDPWATYATPPLPPGVLPAVIEDFAGSQGELMGADPGGVAAAGLAVCAAAISDGIGLRVKRHDETWVETARLWVALVGGPSVKKSPILAAASRPLEAIDGRLFREHQEAHRAFAALPVEERARRAPPPQQRAILKDVTVEAAQEILRDSPDGVLCLQDELSGWFGAMDKYSGSRGAAKDRAFWLQAFNGGSHSVNRVGRGAIWIDNLSISLLGGIQPEPMRSVVADSLDDGLVQRLLPVVMASGGVDVDAPQSPAVADYAAAVRRLHGMLPPLSCLGQRVPLIFTDAAQEVRSAIAIRNHDMLLGWASINGKLASHIGKYDGLFARLCVVFHCIDSEHNALSHEVSEDTARRAGEFLHNFFFRHALAFYSDVLGMTDRHDAVLATAGYILSRKLKTVTARDVRRGDRLMRNFDDREVEAVMSRLDGLGWLDPQQSLRSDSRAWIVRPAVHAMFEERAEKERARRDATRAVIAASLM